MNSRADGSDTILQVEDLHKSYGATEALRGVSFAVPRGSFYGFFGRNGAGKTTTLDIITGLLGRDKGVIRLLGEEVGAEPLPETKQRFAYVGGHILLYDWMTLADHLDYVSGFYPTWDAERSRQLTDLFRLPMSQRVGTLSPGQHLQFQLLMALPRRPELLIIDEPGNLDVVVRADLMDTLIGILEARESTVLMASHLINELEGVCDWLCIIDKGVTVTAGAVQELVAEVREIHFEGVSRPDAPGLEGIWRRKIGANELRVLMAGYTDERAARLAQELGATSHEVAGVTLEDFFIALTTDKD